MLFTLGSDMELFAKKPDGEHVALCGLIGGTKEEPLQIKGLPEGYMIQEDNVAFEFNIPAAEHGASFAASFQAMRTKIAQILNKLGFSMSEEASVSFRLDQLSHPNAMVFGCEPDFDAWLVLQNKKPHAKDPGLRTAGGHIHCGTDIPFLEGTKFMDLYLGVPSVILDDKPSSLARRELYGKAGAMRPKPYGFEYRTLSNFWMFDDALVNWVYKQAYKACGGTEKPIDGKLGKTIVNCINTGDKATALDLVKQFNISMPYDPAPIKKQTKTVMRDWTNQILDTMLIDNQTTVTFLDDTLFTQGTEN